MAAFLALHGDESDLENHMEYKYWRNVSRGAAPVSDFLSSDAIDQKSVSIQEVSLDDSLIGRTIVFLYRAPLWRHSGTEKQLRLRCEGTVLSIGHAYLNYAGDQETFVELQRADGTTCGLGLSLDVGTMMYWTRAIDSEFCLWYVRI